MPATAVVGTQWGDEGKGRVADYLAEKSDLVIRFQGGANAGHTIVNEHGLSKLHLLPSGAFHDHVTNALGPGTVLDLAQLLSELEALTEVLGKAPKIHVSDRAHVVLPLHRRLEAALEENPETLTHSSTGRGIAPAYQFKAAKVGLQVADLLGGEEHLRERLGPIVAFANIMFRGLGAPEESLDETLDVVMPLAKRIEGYVGDTSLLVHEHLEQGKEILLEGQLGTLRDLDWGIYPYTTSSNPLAGYGSVGGGVPPHAIRRVVGVTKSYSSSVGKGPFVAEIQGPEAEIIREEGREYGTTTGRSRSIGWFDLVATRHGCRVQGATTVCLTLLDVLSHVEKISICTHYEVGDRTLEHFPTGRDLLDARPRYREFAGWSVPISDVRRFEDLPREARDYVLHIEESLGIPIEMISVGPHREQMIVRPRGESAAPVQSGGTGSVLPSGTS